jgi:hypothetical protein
MTRILILGIICIGLTGVAWIQDEKIQRQEQTINRIESKYKECIAEDKK